MAYFRCVGGVGGGATLTLTYSSEFYGETITATDGTKTVTKVAPSTGTMDITLPESGTWVVSATIDGQTYSTTVTVDIGYSATLFAIPNGSTVTPTDDIQTWLKCAGITDKTTYTTLSDVLSDTDTLIALCADSNACDYMARSTNWASGVAADSTAMLIVGKYNYCANALLDDNTWETAIRNSAYSSYVDPVPVTWSNTLIHSAVEDNIFYMDDGSPVPLCGIPVGDTIDVDLEAYKGQTLTLVSTVAKDPTNLSNDYSKSIRITPNVTEIYLMPLKILYWWGHEDSNLEACTTANGWTPASGHSFASPSHNTNDITLSSVTNTMACIGTKNNIITGTIKGIAQGVGGGYGYFTVRSNKNMQGATQLQQSTHIDATTQKKYEVIYTEQSTTFLVQAYDGASSKIYALWYE